MNEALRPDDVTEGSTPARDDVTQRVAPAPVAPPTVEPPPRRRRNWLLWIVIAAALAAAAAYAWKRYESPAPSANREEASGGRPAGPPQTVRVAPVLTGDMPLTIDALGTVTPFETVTIRTQIAGNLQNVGFTEGQIVKQGDFIAQIDPRPYEAALAQAQGQLAKDQALLGQAQSDLTRYQQLAKQDSIAQQQVADQVALVAQDKAAIAADQAMVKTAELNVAYTHIVSPVTGRVGLRLVDPGNYLQPSDVNGIVVITQIDPISVVFTTPESNLPQIGERLHAGAKLPVTVLDRDNVHALATGTLTTYDSQIDVTTGTIKMRATFANPDGVLFPQQFVNVRLLVDTMTGVTLAPNPAIQLGASGNFVYLLNDDATVSMRAVAIGPTDGKHTVVTSGLKAGDKVVIDGVDRLRDGAKVKIADHPVAVSGQAGGGGGPGSRVDSSGSSGAGPAQGAEEGAGQHHRHRHDQSGAAGDLAPPATQTNSAPAADAPAQGPAQGEGPSTAPTPPGSAPSGAAAPQPATGGAPAQGAAK